MSAWRELQLLVFAGVSLGEIRLIRQESLKLRIELEIFSSLSITVSFPLVLFPDRF